MYLGTLSRGEAWVEHRATTHLSIICMNKLFSSLHQPIGFHFYHGIIVLLVLSRVRDTPVWGEASQKYAGYGYDTISYEYLCLIFLIQ